MDELTPDGSSTPDEVDTSRQAAPGADDVTVRVRYVAGAASVPPRPPGKRHGWNSPTLTRLDDSPEVMPQFEMARVASRRSHRLRWWIAGAAAVLIAVVAVVLLQFRSDQSGPAQAVRQYFAALSSGDTATAMGLVDNASSYTGAANPLLSAQALAKPGDRPSQADITGSAPTTVNGGQTATAVSVTYDIDGTPVQQTIIVQRSGGGSSQPYVLKAPFITVTVASAHGRPVKVNGIDYPGDASQMLAYPGAYAATVAGTKLVAGADARATYDTASGAVKADIWLPAPEIAPGATEAVQSAVNRALDACAASTSATPPKCPFRYSDSGATLKWKFVSYPKIRTKIDGSGAVTFDDGGHGGSVHYDATTGGFLGLFPSTQSGTLSVDVAGAAGSTGDAVTVTFSP